MNPIFSHGGICAAVAAPDVESATEAVHPFLDQVDVVEVRLDAMHDIHIRALSEGIPCPLLFTNRPTWEGGAYQGSEDDRIAPLIEAVRQHASYVDLELKTGQHLRNRLLKAMEDTTTQLIISHHNFDETPDAASLLQTLREQAASGAQVGKIVTMAHDHLDVLRVLNLQNEAKKMNFPLIAFCMGEAGKISRIITLLLGGFMTYAALNEEQATAPGQLSITQVKEALALLA